MVINSKKSFNDTIKNIVFILKLCIKAKPLYVILIILDAIRGSVSIFLEHTLGIAFILEAAENNYPFHDVLSFIIFLILFIVLGMLFNNFVQQYYAAKISPFMYQKIKLLIYEKAKNTDLESYEDPEYYNSYMICVSQIDTQINKCISLLQGFASNLTTALLTGAFFVSKDSGVILFVFLSCILRLWSGKLLGKLRYNIKMEANKYERKREYLKRMFYLDTYAKEIRLFPSAKEMLLDEFDNANEKCELIERKYVKKRFFLSVLYSYFSTDFISYVLFVSYLVYRVVVSGSIKIGVFAVLFTSFSKLKTSILSFTDLYTEAVENSLFIQKIREFLDKKNKIINIDKTNNIHEFNEICLDRVSFSYDSDAYVLNDFSLNINKGEKVAIVGYNGAGKSTLVKLLLRLYDVNDGAILVNGHNIKSFNVNSYRHSIGTVFQDYTVFPMSISENVKMDIVNDYDEKKIDDSLEASGLLELVCGLKSRKDTIMTKEFDENGAVFSGGQMQRFALARTFFVDPDFIIMDEPSSALDPISEFQLNQIMINMSKDKTIIFISHRLSTVKIADRIILMENGRIVEIGSHNELMRIGGKYYEMFTKQSSLYSLDC